MVQEKAKEVDEAKRLQFRTGLRYLVLYHPNQALLIDETHKDRSACRRSRAYGRVGENLELSSWFNDYVRYTMIGAANIYGFIPEACEIIRCDGNQVSKIGEGSGGTVNRERFIRYLKENCSHYW